MKKTILFLIILGFQAFPQALDTLKILTGCFFSDSSMSDRIIVTRCIQIDSFVIENSLSTYALPRPQQDFSFYLSNIKYDQLQLQWYADYSWTSILDFVIDENGNVSQLYVRDSLIIHYDDKIIKEEFQKLKFTPCKFENKNVPVKAKLYITSYPQIREYLPDNISPEKDFNEDDLIILNKPFIAERYSAGNQRRKEARADIANGYVLIIHGGMLTSINPQVDSIANTFGFHFIKGACTDVYGREEYNDEVAKYLIKRNGKGWWDRFLNEVSKLNLKEHQSLPIINSN